VDDPQAVIEGRLAAYLRSAARERLARWRRDPDARSVEAVIEDSGLLDPRTLEAFDAAESRGQLAGEELAATAAHLADAFVEWGWAALERAQREALESRVTVDSRPLSGVELLRQQPTKARARGAVARRDLAERWVRAKAEGLERLEEATAGLPGFLRAHARTGDVRPPPDPEVLLTATDAAYRELRDRLGHRAGAPREAADLCAFAAVARDRNPPDDRWRRLSEGYASLGLRGALARRGRAEARHDGLFGVKGAVLVLEAPHDVRVAPGSWQLGLPSELAAAEALGTALGHVLVHPALPFALRMPRHASVARSLGALAAHWHTLPEALARRGRTGREAREEAEAALFWQLLRLRVAAAREQVRNLERQARHREASEIAFGRALGVEVPPSTASMLGRPSGPFEGATLRAAAYALALPLHLRERFDEDWWRNPRCGELLRAAAERGPRLSVEEWGEELGVELRADLVAWLDERLG
jgi:hypothetical protein